MSYDTIEGAVLTLVQVLGNYSTTNSSRRDHRILAKGVVRAVVLMPGPVLDREVVQAPRRIRTVWSTQIDLYRNYFSTRVLVTAINSLETDHQELLDHFDKYPTLNGVSGVIHSFIAGAGDIDMFVGENGQWLVRRLVLQTEERITVTIAE